MAATVCISGYNFALTRVNVSIQPVSGGTLTHSGTEEWLITSDKEMKCLFCTKECI